MKQCRESWEHVCAVARQAGNPEPPMPEEIAIRTPVLAKDFPLPPCSFPVEGFVEPPLPVEEVVQMEEDSSDEEEEEEEVKPRPAIKRRVAEMMTEDEREALQRSVRRALAMRAHVVEPQDSSDDAEDQEEPTNSDTEFINDDSESEAEETDDED